MSLQIAAVLGQSITDADQVSRQDADHGWGVTQEASATITAAPQPGDTLSRTAPHSPSPKGIKRDQFHDWQGFAGQLVMHQVV